MKKGLLACFLIVIFAGLGAGVGIVYPYAQALFGEDKYEQQRATQYILNETTDAWKPRATVGGLAGGGLMFLVLMTRKGPDKA